MHALHRLVSASVSKGYQLEKSFSVPGGQRGQEGTSDRAGVNVKGRRDKLLAATCEGDLDHVTGSFGVSGDLSPSLHSR